MGPHSWEWCVHRVPWTVCRREQYNEEVRILYRRANFLGASPDGIIEMDGKCHKIIEIKCPYSFRDSSVEEACSKGGFYCTMEDGVLCLKRDHLYYYQIQGTMAITGAVECDFIVWTPKSINKQYYLTRYYGRTKCYLHFAISIISACFLI